MKIPLYNLKGKLVKATFQKYRINWNTESASSYQTAVKKFLRQYWCTCLVCEEFRIPGTKLRTDFLNFTKKIAVEVHGEQHYEFNPFFHKNRENYKMSFSRDSSKEEWYSLNNFELLEIKFDEINNLTPEYCEEVIGVKII